MSILLNVSRNRVQKFSCWYCPVSPGPVLKPHQVPAKCTWKTPPVLTQLCSDMSSHLQDWHWVTLHHLEMCVVMGTWQYWQALSLLPNYLQASLSLFSSSNKANRKYSLSLLSDAAGGFRAKFLLPSGFLKRGWTYGGHAVSWKQKLVIVSSSPRTLRDFGAGPTSGHSSFLLKCWASHWHSCKSVGKSSFGSSSGPEGARHGLISVPDRCFHCLQFPVSHMEWNSCFLPAVPALSLGFHAKFVCSESVTGAWEDFCSQIIRTNWHRRQGEKEAKKSYRWDLSGILNQMSDFIYEGKHHSHHDM